MNSDRCGVPNAKLNIFSISLAILFHSGNHGKTIMMPKSTKTKTTKKSYGFDDYKKTWTVLKTQIVRTASEMISFEHGWF